MSFEHKFPIKQVENLFIAEQKILGKGSFGEVLLGFYCPIKRFVAVKIMNFAKMEDFRMDKYLESEIINMKNAVHPNIVQLYDVKISHKKNIYLIQEYCNGGSLESYLEQRGRLSEKEVLHFIKKIITGYKHLYEKKIVHRDLKPSNILLHEDEVKICDFGFSKLMEKSEILHSRVGTLPYMSPQILAGREYTAKSDIWSLGVIFYHLLFGKHPWIDLKNNFVSAGNILKIIENNLLHFPKEIIVSEKSKNLIRGMLMFEEEERDSWENMFNEIFFHESVYNEEMLYVAKDHKEFSSFEVIKNAIITQQIMETFFSNKDCMMNPDLKFEKQMSEKNYSPVSLNNLDKMKSFFIQKIIIFDQNKENKQLIEKYFYKRNKAVFYIFISQKIFGNKNADIHFMKVGYYCLKYANIILKKFLTKSASNKPQNLSCFMERNNTNEKIIEELIDLTTKVKTYFCELKKIFESEKVLSLEEKIDLNDNFNYSKTFSLKIKKILILVIKSNLIKLKAEYEKGEGSFNEGFVELVNLAVYGLKVKIESKMKKKCFKNFQVYYDLIENGNFESLIYELKYIGEERPQ